MKQKMMRTIKRVYWALRGRHYVCISAGDQTTIEIVTDGESPFIGIERQPAEMVEDLSHE